LLADFGLFENVLFTYKNAFCSKKSHHNIICTAQALEAFGVLSDSATGSFGTFSIPVVCIANCFVDFPLFYFQLRNVPKTYF